MADANTKPEPDQVSGYTVLTYDSDKDDWTPQEGLSAGPYTKWGLRAAIRGLRHMGYEGAKGDPSVLVQRTGP